MRYLVLATALGLSAAGCSSEAEKPAAGTAPVSSSEFPNLATVPNQAPQVTPRPEREKLLQGLKADRANAEYLREQLNAETARVAPAAPPPPAPRVPKSNEPAQDGAAPNAGPETAESAAPPAPAPQIAALPTGLGEPMALIYFDQGSADLTDQDRAVLHDVVAAYKRQRGSRVRIIGHASKAEGSADAGSAEGGIAMARANAVAETLASLGISASSIEIVTGAARPTYDESVPTGAAANRRVEIFLGP